MQSEKINITAQQKECIEFKPEGSLLVRGIPGSGKTTVLLERAKWLDANAPHNTKGDKVIVLTYNVALTNFMRQLSIKNGAPVTASTFHSWAIRLLKSTGQSNLQFISSDEQYGLVSFARNIVMKKNPEKKLPEFEYGWKYRRQINFLIEEISWLKEQSISDRATYLGVQRIGRGSQVRVTREIRSTIFDIYEQYMQLLCSKRKIDFDDVVILLEDKVDAIINKKINPSHILVDEAQDLNTRQLKLLGKLADQSLTIAADKGQKIYRRQFTWKSVGIDIHKNRSKFLLNTFRSTREIIGLARCLQEYDILLKNDDEFLPTEEPAATGPLPQLLINNNMADELRKVTNDIVSALRTSFPEDTVAIIANSNYRLDEFASALDQLKIPWLKVKEDSADLFTPGIKLVSFYSAKGLEFDHTIVTGLKEGVLPHSSNYNKNDKDEIDEAKDIRCTELRKLYVAMTRAKLNLILSAVTPVSEFINLIDSGLYRPYRGV